MQPKEKRNHGIKYCVYCKEDQLINEYGDCPKCNIFWYDNYSIYGNGIGDYD